METFLCKLRKFGSQVRVSMCRYSLGVGLYLGLCLLYTLLAVCKAKGAEIEQRVPSTITNVTVFLNQAQVTRVAKFSLQPGITQLVFDHVSPFINLNSIQVKTESNITLLSVSHRNNYLVEDNKPSYILELEDTLEAVKRQIALVKIRQESLNIEKDVILSNKQIGGANSGVKADDLEDMLLLFRKRTQEIGEELLTLTATERKLGKIQGKLQAQLNEYINSNNGALEVVVTVKALSEVSNARIEWNYLVSNTGWRPFYDIRVKDTQSPLQLVSKAYITQTTGEEWKNVILKLSTANPNEGGTKPELQPDYIRYYEPVPVYGYEDQTKKPRQKEKMVDEAVQTQSMMAPPVNADKSAPELNASPGIAAVEQSETNVEFNVTSAYTIPSDNNPHQVDLTVNNLQAHYAYGAVPKLDKDAFVTATVSGNDIVNQMSGEANVYFDGTYTGKTYINGTTNDSMLLSLGRDKRIQIQRVMLKDFTSKSSTGSNRKELNTWEINVRNTRKEAITIIIEDQVPVSTDKDIEIKLIKAEGAKVDEPTGKLTWTIRLEPEQTQTLRFSFEVKYPKEKRITTY